MSSDASQTTVPTREHRRLVGLGCSERDTVRHAAMMAHHYPRRGEPRRAVATYVAPRGDRRWSVARSATGRSTRSSSRHGGGRRASTLSSACAGSPPGPALAAGAVGRLRLAASSVILVATESGLAQYDRTLFSLHVVQHMLLGMVAPLLLVLGRAGHAGAPGRAAARRSGGILRVLHSRPVTVLTHPLTVWVLFGGTLVVALLHRPLRAVAAQRRGATRWSTRTSSRRRACSSDTSSGIDPIRARARLRRPPALRARAAAVPHVRRRRAARQRPRSSRPVGTRRSCARGAPARSTTSGLGAGILWGAGELFGVRRLGDRRCTSGCGTRSGRAPASTGASTPSGVAGSLRAGRTRSRRDRPHGTSHRRRAHAQGAEPRARRHRRRRGQGHRRGAGTDRHGPMVWLTDSRAAGSASPADKIAYVEIDEDGATKHVGFGR